MNNNIISGRKIAKKIEEKLKITSKCCFQYMDRLPKLVIIQVGNNTESDKYIKYKLRACKRINIICNHNKLKNDISEKELVNIINKFNKDNLIDGILLQLPLPEHLDSSIIIENINPFKDVDGLHSYNIGKLTELKKYPNNISSINFIIPPTALGIIKILEYQGINFTGKNAVVIGRSNIVGKPISLLLLAKNCTVTICHSYTTNIQDIVKNADILVVAVGVPKLVKKDWIKPGAYIIDVGMNYSDGKLCGDVDYDNVHELTNGITPVPGGVGPLTIAMLLYNILHCIKMNQI